MVVTIDDFEAVAEAETDTRGRVTLSRAGATPGRRYRVESNPDGVLLLIPVISIPERELLAWQNPEIVREVHQGIEDARAGRTVDLGDFSQYLDETEADE